MPDPHINFGQSTVLTAPSPIESGTTLVLAPSSTFPAEGIGPYNVTIWAAGETPNNGNAEIARVTAQTGDTLTIIRAQEYSNARYIQVGDQIAVTVTAKTLTDTEAIGQTIRVPVDDVYMSANSSATPLEEYVMDDTYELVFGDLSEMAVLL